MVVPLEGAGSELHINANAEGGSLVAEIADGSGRPIQGFEASSCQPLQENSLDHILRWSSEPAIPVGEGVPLQITVKLTNAEIFSLWWQ